MSIKRRSRVVEISLSLSSLEVAIFGLVFLYNIDHHVQHLSGGGGAEVLRFHPVTVLKRKILSTF
jgi:hypothetical protein